MTITNIKVVSKGAIFCECGGMMEACPNTGLLMSDPPKVKIQCFFCGEIDYVLSPYNVQICFMRNTVVEV